MDGDEPPELSNGGWEFNKCQDIKFYPNGDVIRLQRKNAETGESSFVRYFSKLTFSYTFTREDDGKSVWFAYSVPYGYTDLVNDLDDIKN